MAMFNELDNLGIDENHGLAPPQPKPKRGKSKIVIDDTRGNFGAFGESDGRSAAN